MLNCYAGPIGQTGRVAKPERSARAEELKAAAVAYLQTEGLFALTFRKLAAALGVAHNTLEHHFGSKEQLVGELLEELRAEQRGRIQGAVRGIQAERGAGAVFATAWHELALAESTPLNYLFLEIVALAARDLEAWESFRADALDGWLHFIAGVLEEVGAPQESVGVLSSLILSVIRGLMVNQALTPEADRAILDDAAELFGAILDDYLARGTT